MVCSSALQVMAVDRPDVGDAEVLEQPAGLGEVDHRRRSRSDHS